MVVIVKLVVVAFPRARVVFGLMVTASIVTLMIEWDTELQCCDLPETNIVHEHVVRM